MKILKKFVTLPLLVAVLAFSFGEAASAQVASPRLAIQLLTSGLTSPLTASSNGATMARLVLDTTGSTEAVRINSLPFTLATGSGALASTLNNCAVYNEADANVALSSMSSANILAQGLNTITLNSSLILNPGTVTTIALRCDVASSLVNGGSYTFSMNTANVSATGVTTGPPAVVTVRGGVVPPVIPPVVPGLPNTGAGGEAGRNAALIFASLFLAGTGLFLARRTSGA